MKKITLLMLAIVASLVTMAQTIKLKTETQNISFQAKNDDSNEIILKNLTFLLTGPAGNKTITVQIQSFTALTKPAFMINATDVDNKLDINFTAADFAAAGGIVVKNVILRYTNAKSLKAAELVYINIKGETDYVSLSLTPSYEMARLTVVKDGSKITPLLSDSTGKIVMKTIQLSFIADGGHKLNESRDTSFKLSIYHASNKAGLDFADGGKITVTADEAKKLNAGEKIVKTITLKETAADPKEVFLDESHFISVEGSVEKYLVEVSNKGIYNPNKPFWVEVGANLDLNDGVDANNFFYGVFLHKRDVRRLSFSKKKYSKSDYDANPGLKNLGIFAGVFQSKTLSDVSENNLTSRSFFNQTSISLKKDGKVGVFVDSGAVKKSRVVKNFGLFFSPQIRLTNGSANDEGLHLFASLWMELQWQRIISSEDYSQMSRIDTIFVNSVDLGKYASVAPKTDFDIRSHYYGFGLPIFFKEGTANVFFNPVIGGSNQPTSGALNDAISNINNNDYKLKRAWKPFYVFQFRLSEEAYGFAFTGEVRGLIVKDSKPFVTLAISKKFDLSKLIEFTK